MAPTVQSNRAPSAPRPTRRRLETRQRLLDSARIVFAENGFGRSTVEQVCDHAGYSRGAFYSNFETLEELFLQMWAQQSEQLLADLNAAMQRPATRQAIASGDPAAVVDRMLAAVPLDEGWYRITAEFTAHALRNPELRKVMAARERAIADTLVPIVVEALQSAGRSVTDPDALGAALVAVHDGTTVQCLMTPDDPQVLQRRTDLFVRVIDSFLSPPTSAAAPIDEG